MTRYFQKSPLPRILEERETNGEVAIELQIPQIQTVSWTDDNVSREWLKRMSTLSTINSRTNLIDSLVVPATKPQPLIHWNMRKCFSLNDVRVHSVAKGFSGCHQSGSSVSDSFTVNCSAGGGTSRRKPDSRYITLISGITNGSSTSSSSERLCTESNPNRILPTS